MEKSKHLLIIIAFFFALCPIVFSQQTNHVDVVKVDNYIINPVTEKFIINALDGATKNNAACLIIELDTPGGLLEPTRELVKRMLSADIPIVVYIAPSGSRAGSAGVFITYASHIAAMAPSTNIGAAHPVGIGIPGMIPGSKKEKNAAPFSEEEIMGAKVMNDTVAWAEGIAKTRNRNVDWIKKAVKESVSVTETEALQKNIINFIAKDIPELLAKIDGKTVKTLSGEKVLATKNAQINYIELSPREKILNTIAHPNIAYLLMMLGIIGLVFEFSHPGMSFPGIGGTICLLLALYSFQLLPINYAGFLLIALGIVLFIAEAFTPAFGLLTLGGVVSFMLGSLMLVKSPSPFLQISLQIIIPTVVAFAAISTFLLANVVKAHRRRVSTGKEGLIGEFAVAHTLIDKKGKVFCHGEIWDAFNTAEEKIEKGDTVIIVSVDGLTLYVQKRKRV